MGADSWWRRFLRRDTPTQLDANDPSLIVVASSFDDAEACSAVLNEAEGWVADRPAVLRHHLVIPAAQVNAVQVIAAQDGYDTASVDESDPATLILQRVQVLDALHCSQERSRMAGLAQRHDGNALGWDALQPAH
ncbi:hypothetical protein JK358_25455 [Nocardia sp. 2]|uniref:Regulator of ribonuclease activity B domain-containing protein n=1 Tax=Nocardia acididurans TaxID=2802282 RepID=A0ABS1MEY6_9NOCA|nr:ribonuclease E inhibitor RraB [Nocardia acididurans]MBL1077753.1 hypothetical protein [Nocardia acididurans]